jgi:hypothetical protein
LTVRVNIPVLVLCLANLSAGIKSTFGTDAANTGRGREEERKDNDDGIVMVAERMEEKAEDKKEGMVKRAVGNRLKVSRMQRKQQSAVRTR